MIDKPNLGRAISYFGGKYRAAPKYPAPKHDTIIEPFAGGAGYSLRYWRRRVILVEKNPDVVGAWRFILERGPEAIAALPLLGPHDDLREMGLDEDARRLMGFWLNSGVAAPCNRLSAWGRSRIDRNPGEFWSPKLRDRLCILSECVRHTWSIIEGEYTCSPDETSTWFVDPPYANAGKHYAVGSRHIDYANLGQWCRSRRGQVVACENQGADWLPFRNFATIKASSGRGRTCVSHEAIWTNDAEVTSD